MDSTVKDNWVKMVDFSDLAAKEVRTSVKFNKTAHKIKTLETEQFATTQVNWIHVHVHLSYLPLSLSLYPYFFQTLMNNSTMIRN